MSLITAGSTYTGSQAIDVVVRPAIKSFLPPYIGLLETKGALTHLITFFGPATHNAMAWTSGWTGGSAATRKQKSVSTGRYKAENTYQQSDYAALVQRESEDIRRGFANGILLPEVMEKFPAPLQSLLTELEGNMDAQTLAIAEWKLQQKGVDISILNTFWLGDTYKLCLESSGGTFPSGASFSRYDADSRFNAANGVWANIILNASTSPSVATGQIKKVNCTLSAVSEVRTITLTGSSGTADVTILGKTKVATYTGGSLTNTAAAFVSSWSSYYANYGMVITASTDTIICTYSGYKGVAFAAPTVANATGNLAGSAALTTAAVASGNMTAGLAADLMDDMYDAQSSAMQAVDDNQKVYYATRSWIRNYQRSLGMDGATGVTSLESQRNAMINGISELRFNGIEVKEMAIDEAISSYFGGYSPHRCILTVKENIKMVTAWNDDFGSSAMWYEKKDNANLTRTEFELGGDFFESLYMVVCFQG